MNIVNVELDGAELKNTTIALNGEELFARWWCFNKSGYSSYNLLRYLEARLKKFL